MTLDTLLIIIITSFITWILTKWFCYDLGKIYHDTAKGYYELAKERNDYAKEILAAIKKIISDYKIKTTFSDSEKIINEHLFDSIERSINKFNIN